MKTELIEASKLDASGILDEVVYEHYYERSLHPSPRPTKIGPVIKGIDIGVLRTPDTYPSYPKIELAPKEYEEKIYDFNGYYIRRYAHKDLKGLHRTMFVYHGGGFMFGSCDRLNNVYKRMAELIDGVVIAVDYTMAPEAAFPVAAIQCYDTIRRVIERKEEFNCDPDKIIVWGDSAGGHLALDASLLDKENKYIKMQILYYPLTDMTIHSTEVFDITKFGKDLPEFVIKKINGTNGGDNMKMIDTYLQNRNLDLSDELISPLMAKDFTVYPRTIMVSAEYDFLTQQNEELVEKLRKAGVDTDFYKFQGNFHGFVERLGFFESADKSLQLIAEIIKKEI